MQVRPISVVRHGQEVWENPTVEAVRRDECLCHHCARMKPGAPDHCPIAQSFFAICQQHGTAFALSRCNSWEEPDSIRYDEFFQVDTSSLEPAPPDPPHVVARRLENVWQSLQRLALEQGEEPPARTAEGATVLGVDDYLPMLLPQLEAIMSETGEETAERWRDFVGYGRQEDAQRVTLPVVLEGLRRFATEGLLDDCFHAIAALMQLLLRELLRRGHLPVLYPLAKLPSNLLDGNTSFPLVGCGGEF